jgi:glutamyl-tRNA reductase
MELILVGINHRSAPLEIREQVAMNQDEVREVLVRMRGDKVLSEVLVLSTCHRTEFYGLSSDNGAAEIYIRDLIDYRKKIDLGKHPGYAYTLKELETARHLFRVSAGLDSIILGEAQILGQVKRAYQMAIECGTNGIILNRLLHAAARVGKRVRTETRLGGGAVSLAGASAELAGKIFSDLSSRSVLLIGVGEMGKLTARHMMERGVSRLTIANRTFDKADELAKELGARALPLDRLDEALASADIVISSTGAPKPIVDVKLMRSILHKRSRPPIYIIDIAVPRDFEPGIGQLDGVFLHNMDSMNLLVKKNLEKRRTEIPKAETIVEKELEGFTLWRRSLVATPAIKRLREKMETIRSQEVARHRKRFANQDSEHIDRLTESVINKILHPLMSHIRRWGEDEDLGPLRIDTIYEAFDLPRSQDASDDHA